MKVLHVVGARPFDRLRAGRIGPTRGLVLRDGRLTARWLRVEWLWQAPLPRVLDVVRELGLL